LIVINLLILSDGLIDKLIDLYIN